MKKFEITVYCSASSDVPAIYFEAARELGQLLAENGYSLIYGGGSVGLMGAVSSAAQEAGGYVVGVIPRALQIKERVRQDADELIVTEDMRSRKAILEGRADGFITLPGGFGTLEEFFEIMTALQLGFHTKPLILLNIAGFYDPLLTYLRQSVEQKFIKPHHFSLLKIVNTPAEAIAALQATLVG